MSLFEQLNEELKQSMRNKDTKKLSVLRMLITDIKNVRIDKQRELTDEEILDIIAKQVKQREDALTQYKQANREDLAKKEQEEKDLLLTYLPAQLTQNELTQLIQEEINNSEVKDFKTIIGKVMPKTKGKADGKKVAELVKELTK